MVAQQSKAKNREVWANQLNKAGGSIENLSSAFRNGNLNIEQDSVNHFSTPGLQKPVKPQPGYFGMHGVFNSGDYGYAAKSRVASDKSQQRVKSAAMSRRSHTSAGIKRDQKSYAGLANLDTPSTYSKGSAGSKTRQLKNTLGDQQSQVSVPGGKKLKQERFNEDFDAKSVGKQASYVSAKNLSLFNRR